MPFETSHPRRRHVEDAVQEATGLRARRRNEVERYAAPGARHDRTLGWRLERHDDPEVVGGLDDDVPYGVAIPHVSVPSSDVDTRSVELRSKRALAPGESGPHVRLLGVSDGREPVCCSLELIGCVRADGEW